MTNNKFSGADSFLGYYYQSLYALIYLLNSIEDSEEVLIEDLDDVVVKNLDNNAYSLQQLKHKQNSTLTEASKDLWSTLRIWCEYTLKNDIRNITFALITCSNISVKSELNVLKEYGKSRNKLIQQLIEEAERVGDERKNTPPGTRLPHQERYLACDVFRKLNATQKKMLFQRIRITPNSFDINATEDQVENSKLLKSCPPEFRPKLVKKLILCIINIIL